MARSAKRSSRKAIWRIRPRPRGVKATDHAYVELKRIIQSNSLPAGKNYLQQDIAKHLGISRTPSREAIIRLACERLVEVHPRHGVRVPLITIAEIREMHECLAALEGHAVRLIIQSNDLQAALQRLVEAQSDMVRAASKDDLHAWVEGDRAFHDGLTLGCGNGHLHREANLLWDRLCRVRPELAKLRASPAVSIREHAAIVRAIRRGDAAKAQELLSLHHEQAARYFIGELQRRGLTAL